PSRDGRLGDHRHVYDNPVAFADALPAEHAGEAGDLLQQRAIREAGDGLSDGAVVDESRLVGAAARHVPVEGVVARVDDATREPAIVRRPRSVEHLVPAPVPVDAVSGLRPEPLGLVAPPRIHLVLRAGHRLQAPGHRALSSPTLPRTSTPRTSALHRPSLAPSGS